MKQLLQDLKTGDVVLEDVPVPSVKPGMVLIQTTRSLISAGTERMLHSFAKANYLQKARQQPERVKEVLTKVRTDGLSTTVDAVRSKLDDRMPLGYCNVGCVIAVGAGVTEFSVGDRVISNGSHAEVVAVPKNLVARIPEDVNDDTAAYTVIASIGLQGVRLMEPTLGERVAVFGLGLVGLTAVQILRANGCQVVGFDFVSERVELARSLGATAHDLSVGVDPVLAAEKFTAGRGVDAVLITASTSSDELIHQAAQMSRSKGRIVLTGVVGLDLQRADFYDKELTFQVSCSYGPGRYDPSYEDDGIDYPLGYVRWTQKRNFEAILDLMADSRIDTGALTTKRVPFGEVTTAYAALDESDQIGIMLQYDAADAPQAILDQRSVPIAAQERAGTTGAPVIGVIGAGVFAKGSLIPGLVAGGARLKYISSSGGVSGSAAARKFSIEQSTTDNNIIFGDPQVDAVAITTRHNSHARLVVAALDADKHVFVEKPLALTTAELHDVELAYERAHNRGKSLTVMVGFNRRFAPATVTMQRLLRGRQGPLAATYVANAGAIPPDHWTHNSAVGGGRIIGEACHFIDYLHHLVAAPIVSVSAAKATAAGSTDLEDIASIQLGFADGSIGTVQYFANGSKSLAKERCELFFDGNVLQMDNYKGLKAFGNISLPRSKPALKQEKGHAEQFAVFVEAVRKGRKAPIPFESLLNVTRASFAAVESMRGLGQILLPAEPRPAASP